MKITLLISLVLSLLLEGCLGKIAISENLLTVERPYRYVLEKGKSVKETMRFPDLHWYHLPIESCISRSEINDLTIYIIQMNLLIDEYEDIVGVKEGE